MGRKLRAVPFWGGGAGLSNTMWPVPRPTCTPSYILIRSTVWSQCTNVTDREDRTGNCLIASQRHSEDHTKNYAVYLNEFTLLSTNNILVHKLCKESCRRYVYSFWQLTCFASKRHFKRCCRLQAEHSVLTVSFFTSCTKAAKLITCREYIIYHKT